VEKFRAWVAPCGSARRLSMVLAAALFGRVCWLQYSILLKRNLPTYRFEFPVIGSNVGVFWHSYAAWARSILGGSPAILTNFFGYNGVMVSWPLYEKYVKKVDNGGQLDQGALPQYVVNLIGENSMLLLKAGKGQEKHRRLRSKVLQSLTPRRVLALTPDMGIVIRDILDTMASETEARGFSKFLDHTSQIPKRITALPIVGEMTKDMSDQLERLMDVWLAGIIAIPVNLGRFSTYGRAMNARSDMVKLIKTLMENANSKSGNIIADLASTSAEDTGFSEMEIVDTILTLCFAGQFTTTEALPPLLVELACRPAWAEKIAAEPLEFDQVEGDSATVRFVREVLRHYPPEVLFFRRNKTCPIDLGEHGHVPVGCNIIMNFGDAMWSLGRDFDPDRWTPSTSHDSFLTFGGSSPHSCVGRSIAMVELQLFARILCREYSFEILDTTQVRNWDLGGLFFKYKHGCKVKISKKS